MKSLVRGLCAILILPHLAVRAETADTRDPVLQVKINANEPDSDIITFEAGRGAGISVGDLFWIVDDAKVCRFGTIHFITETACAGRFLHKTDGPPCSATAYVLLQHSLVKLRQQFPRFATIGGKLSRIEKNTGWVNIGRSAGLKLGDTILIRRLGIPIARGKVELLESGGAMIAYEALVTNASPQADDTAELWPAPGDASFRVNSTVLDVTSAKEGDIITIVGNANDGFVEGRQIDIFHDDQFVGVASLLKMDGLPVSRARMTKAATRNNQSPDEGDWAYVRVGVGATVGPLSAVIFRVEAEYCLLAAGEVDGLTRGEKLLVYEKNAKNGLKEPVAEITVDKVNVSYSGGTIRILNPAKALQMWSFAERSEPRIPEWNDIGQIKNIESDWRLCTAALNQNVTIKSGSIVGLVAEGSDPPATGLILTHLGEDVVVYIPPGWGDLDRVKGARVTLVKTQEAINTQPAGSLPADDHE